MRRPGFEPGLPDWQSDVLDQTGRPSRIGQSVSNGYLSITTSMQFSLDLYTTLDGLIDVLVKRKMKHKLAITRLQNNPCNSSTALNDYRQAYPGDLTNHLVRRQK